MIGSTLVDFYDDSEVDPVLRAVASSWKTKIEKARSHKRRVFGDAAREAYEFYSGPRNWSDLMRGTRDAVNGVDEGGDGFPDPTFKISVNKTFEFVSIFGPALYYENPVRTVKPRPPIDVPMEFFPDPMMFQSLVQQEQMQALVDSFRSKLIGGYLNWTPQNGLSQESRDAIDEALITGAGCVWTELYEPPGSNMKVVRSIYDSVENLQIDPDAPSLDGAKWIAQRCIEPTWEVEKTYGLRLGSLKGNVESQESQADNDARADGGYDRRRGLTNDLIIYYKIYSKMGLGGRLQGANKDFRPALEMFGDYCLIVVTESCPFPLNLPPDVTNDPSFGSDPELVFARTAWPTPFWGADLWPVAVLAFHKVHQCAWPMPHLKAGIGELRFLNWVMSFLAGKLHTSCRDLIALRKSLADEVKETVLHGKDLELIELEADHGTISELVQVLQMPSVNGDIWKMIEAVERNFDKRVGLTELMYGGEGQTQIRSAEEADLRGQGMNVRPQDMAKQVEAWQADIAVREAIASRYHLGPDDIRPILGPLAAACWMQYVASRDVQVICHQLEYHIEAGSTQRPNKSAEVRQMNDAMQVLLTPLMTYMQQTGDSQPLNNLLADYAKSRDLDAARYQLRAAMPPPAMAGPVAGSHPNSQEPTGNPVPQG